MSKLLSSPINERYRDLMNSTKGLRQRDAAERLNATEAELVAANCGCESTQLDVSDWISFIKELKLLGRVMVLTRNDHCVHERKGCYESIIGHGKRIGLVTGKDIDLRLFFEAWQYAFAVTAPGRGGKALQSIQFFDRYGNAVHKAYPQESDRQGEYESLVERFRAAEQSDSILIDAKPAKTSHPSLEESQQATFLDEWEKLQDTHDFFPLLGRYDVGRLQAMEIAEGRFTRRLDTQAARTVLEQARDQEVSIMVFVGNDSAIQIHTGPVQKLAISGEWFNVLDPDFNLHLNETGIASAWHVTKPTKDGDVNSLELYDADGEIIAQFFGARKPGIPERSDWRQICDGL
ncbi:MAG: ChuX/HutX family heme-like substrate-binding protein [Verrucomicrobiota bacterium]